MNEAGRGKKLCKCGEYVGVRTTTHSCGHTFKAKVPASGEAKPVEAKPIQPWMVVSKAPVQVVRKTQEYPDYIPYKNHRENGTTSYLVFIPKGTCPFKLENFTKNGIISWADKVFEESEKSGCILSVAALRYWADKYTKYDEKEKRETIGCTLLAHAKEGTDSKTSIPAFANERVEGKIEKGRPRKSKA